MQKQQYKLNKLFAQVNDEMKDLGIPKNLKLLCSAELDAGSNNQVNLIARPMLTRYARCCTSKG